MLSFVEGWRFATFFNLSGSRFHQQNRAVSHLTIANTLLIKRFLLITRAKLLFGLTGRLLCFWRLGDLQRVPTRRGLILTWFHLRRMLLLILQRHPPDQPEQRQQFGEKIQAPLDAQYIILDPGRHVPLVGQLTYCRGSDVPEVRCEDDYGS